MSAPSNEADERSPADGDALRRWGAASWRLLGIALLCSLVFTVVVALSGLVVPLLLAVILGALCVPIVDRLEARRIPRVAGALIVVLSLVAIGTTIGVMLVRGVLNESILIRATVIDALGQIDDWLGDNSPISDPVSTVDDAAARGRHLLSGAAWWMSTIFSSAMTFAIGTFLAAFMCYYILADWADLRRWLSRHLGVPGHVGEAIIDDATQVVRRGFGALSLTNLVTASVIAMAMVLLGIPLALAVGIVTFIASFVPYLGPVVSGTFAFLVALGSDGFREAVILLVVVLVAQSMIQTIVGNRFTTDRLSLHPLPSILSSVCGVAIAGVLGAVLSAPALALGIAVSRRLKDPAMMQSETGSRPDGP
ncbi:MAG: AI-2E family transporter [Ilumatobacteraceae bacterium]